MIQFYKLKTRNTNAPTQSKDNRIIVNSLDEERYTKVLSKWNKAFDDEENESDERQEDEKMNKVLKKKIEMQEIMDNAWKTDPKANGIYEKDENGQWTCQQNHPLVEVCGQQNGYNTGLYCNICTKQVDMNNPWRRCKLCDFDLCKQCIDS